MLLETSRTNNVDSRSDRRTVWVSASASTISVITPARNMIATARRTVPKPARLRKLVHTSGGRISGIRISHQGWPNVIDRFPTIAD